jgi:hypothetical protein
MPWQEVGVVVVVAGAVYFLARKLFGIGVRRKKAPSTFIPLESLKKSDKRRRAD